MSRRTSEPNSDLLVSIAWRRTRGARSRSGAPAYSLRRCCSSLSLSKRAASCDNLTAGPRVSLAGPLICLSHTIQVLRCAPFRTTKRCNWEALLISSSPSARSRRGGGWRSQAADRHPTHQSLLIGISSSNAAALGTCSTVSLVKGVRLVMI